ncbi:hypothetical protein GCM10027456_39950 [Kineosporia babensis]
MKKDPRSRFKQGLVGYSLIALMGLGAGILTASLDISYWKFAAGTCALVSVIVGGVIYIHYRRRRR